MLGTVGIYLIWYGNWAGNTGPSILETMVSNMGGTPWMGIETTYYDYSTGTHLSDQIAFRQSYYPATQYAYGTTLSDAQIQQIVVDAFNAGLTKDSNAVYFVMTDSTVTASSGFCTNYCGWHSAFSTNSVYYKYGFIGNAATLCPNSCTAQSASPNNNRGADAMASVLSHEIVESQSDPLLNAWTDGNGDENADKCAWTFGTTYTTPAPGGGVYNVNWGGHYYLIQRNWLNGNSQTQRCAIAYP
jgi:hypothetical protein